MVTTGSVNVSFPVAMGNVKGCQAGVGDGCCKEQNRPVLFSLVLEKLHLEKQWDIPWGCVKLLFCWNKLSFSCSESSSSHERADL